jgi:hypothetical protein
MSIHIIANPPGEMVKVRMLFEVVTEHTNMSEYN